MIIIYNSMGKVQGTSGAEKKDSTVTFIVGKTDKFSIRRKDKMGKRIRLIFKSGAITEVMYSSKAFTELCDNLGKDHVVETKNYSVNTKELQAAIFVPAENELAEE